GDNKLKKLDSSGSVVMSVSLGSPNRPAFDGTNIWVSNFNENSISVVRAIGGFSGTVLATLTGNGLNGPSEIAFDGERIMAINLLESSVALWKASDLTPLGTFSAGGFLTRGVC